jgi:hypothetical protein
MSKTNLELVNQKPPTPKKSQKIKPPKNKKSQTPQKIKKTKQEK